MDSTAKAIISAYKSAHNDACNMRERNAAMQRHTQENLKMEREDLEVMENLKQSFKALGLNEKWLSDAHAETELYWENRAADIAAISLQKQANGIKSAA